MLEAGGEAMDAQKTGALIAQARRERGLTQKELSQALHVLSLIHIFFAP